MTNDIGFGGKHLDKPVFDYIYNTVPHGNTILELGSGWVTGQLAQYYYMYSIEENIDWLYHYNSYYIYAPLRDGWYDADILSRIVPRISYSCIIVDGPFRRRHRRGFFDHLYLFDSNAMIIFDEVNYKGLHQLMQDAAHTLNHTYHVYNGGKDQFGVTRPLK